MMMKKTLLSLLTSFSLLSSNAKAEDIFLTPTDSWVEKLQSYRGTPEDRVHVSLDSGVYSQDDNSILNIDEYVDIQGKIVMDDLSIKLGTYEVVTGASTIMKKKIDAGSNTSFSNLVFDNQPLTLYGDGLFVKNCYFYDLPTASLYIYSPNTKETSIEDCTFRNCVGGIANQDRENPEIKVRDSKFIECDYPALTYYGIDLGTIADEGNNVFVGKEYNVVNYSTQEIKAEGNFWYGKNESLHDGNSSYILLKDDASIKATILNLAPQSKSTKNRLFQTSFPIDYIPYRVDDFFQVLSSVDNFDLYK